MSQFQKVSMFFLRVSIGWLFFYAGITKVLDPKWSAAGYLKGAKIFTGFYNSLLAPSTLTIVNFLNEWGLTVLGLSLIFGIFVKRSAILGVVLMLLYYLPLGIWHPNAHSLVVDEHIIYIFSLLLLASLDAGRTWGLDNRLRKIKS